MDVVSGFNKVPVKLDLVFFSFFLYLQICHDANTVSEDDKALPGKIIHTGKQLVLNQWVLMGNRQMGRFFSLFMVQLNTPLPLFNHTPTIRIPVTDPVLTINTPVSFWICIPHTSNWVFRSP